MKLSNPVKNIKWSLYPYGDVTQYFGENEALYTRALKDSYPEYYEKVGKFIHSGIDIVRPYAEHLFAVEDGKVTYVKDSPTGYGKHVTFRTEQDDDGYMREWTYGHMSYIHVKKGERIKAGQFIGSIGNTGFVVSNSTGNGYWNDNPYAGTHLHLGYRILKNGVVQNYNNGAFGRLDPLPLFLDQSLLSSKILNFAIEKDDATLYQFYNLLKVINL